MSTQDNPPMFEDKSEGFEIRFHKGGVIFSHAVGLGEVDYHAHAGQVDEIYEAFKAIVNLWWPTHGDLPPIGESVLARRLIPTYISGTDKPKEVFVAILRQGSESSWSWAQPELCVSYPVEEITHWQPLPRDDLS